MSGDHLSTAYETAPQRGITRAEITFDTKDCSEQQTDQLLGAMHRVLSAQRRVSFTIQSDGAELEGDADEIPADREGADHGHRNRGFQRGHSCALYRSGFEWRDGHV